MPHKGGHKGGGKKAGGKAGALRSGRMKAVRVKTAAKRTTSSTQWLARQLNDPYVHAARREGYRSRAAFKLIELDEKFGLLRPGMRVVDLGAAPGGWSQVVAGKLSSRTKTGQLVALDILPMDPIGGADIIEADFTADDAPRKIENLLKGPADLVLSDMAAPATGHQATDHLRIMGLADMAYDFAAQVLAPGGAFVCKLFQGGAQNELLQRLKRDFASVKHAKPPASRAESAETYVVAQGFRGQKS